jgi:RHS repeat-associated protein
LVTDENKNIVSTITYHPFGEKYLEEGSEKHLYTGKEKDITGLYYYGARYYDPETGRFITRDQRIGRISQPQTLNQYTYCINNPTRYIDPDGHSYFDPDWAKEWQPDDESGYSWNAAMKSLALWLHKAITKGMSAWGGWLKRHRTANSHAGSAAGAGAGIVAGLSGAGTILSGILGLTLCVMFTELSDSAEFYNEMWEDDPQYRELVSTAEYYLNLFEMGVDCEQELLDALLETYIYMLQARYGDGWRAYAQPNVLMAYDMMIERKEQSQGNEYDEPMDSPGESGGSPPDLKLI